jgi:hypothetical protein
MASVKSLFCDLVLTVTTCRAQTPPQVAPPSPPPQAAPPAPAPAPPSLPVTVQIKKTIVFLETDCLHDFGPDIQSLPREAALQLPAERQLQVLTQLIGLTEKLRQVKPALQRLSPDEAARLPPPPNLQPEKFVDEIEWRLQIVSRMMQFTDAEVAAFLDNDLQLLPLENHRGTGFLVGYVDSRLKPPNTTIRYLITNRHVAQPGVENGTPCRIVSSYILLNHKPDGSHPSNYAELSRTDKIIHWSTPDDPSVDLAATTLGFDENTYDHIVVPVTQFVSDDDLKNHKVVEGDPVLFAGLFIQTFDEVHTLEPIVRTGSLAMVPEGLLPTTLQKRPGRIFLADAHAFGGNSGSPVFVDPDKYSGTLYTMPRLEMLGVLSGMVSENTDFTLNVTTTISGNLPANSGVSVVVPAFELKRLLEAPTLKEERDKLVASQQSAK